jgi:hypothetical protein
MCIEFAKNGMCWPPPSVIKIALLSVAICFVSTSCYVRGLLIGGFFFSFSPLFVGAALFDEAVCRSGSVLSVMKAPNTIFL